MAPNSSDHPLDQFLNQKPLVFFSNLDFMEGTAFYVINLYYFCTQFPSFPWTL